MIEEKIFENDLEGAGSYIDIIADGIRNKYGIELRDLGENDPVSEMSGMPSNRYSEADKEGIIHIFTIGVIECYPKPKQGSRYTHFISTVLKESEEGSILKKLVTGSGRTVEILGGVRLRQPDFNQADKYFKEHFEVR